MTKTNDQTSSFALINCVNLKSVMQEFEGKFDFNVTIYDKEWFISKIIHSVIFDKYIVRYCHV